MIEGLVSGYNHDPSRSLFQKDKPITLEGTLDRVEIKVLDNGASIHTAYTNKKGEFQLKLSFGKIYKIELSKNAHAKSIFLIDVRAASPEVAPNGLRFNGAELVLNSFISKDTAQINQPFGRLYFDVRKKMIDFEAAQIKSKSGLFTKRDEPNTSVSLMKRAVIKNKDNFLIDQKAADQKAEKKAQEAAKKNFIRQWSKNKTEPVVETSVAADSVKVRARKISSRFDLNPNAGVENFSEYDLSSRESEIEKARKQLEEDKAHAGTKEDSLLIQERESLLNAAVVELHGAKRLIEMQKNEISTQRNLLISAIISVLLLISFLYFFFKHSREKKKNHLLLKDKTKKITDSINYAKYIQQSILPQESEIHKLFPRSFIYYKPRDIVSGDFYWVSELDDKIIIAAVDCTGHGVPGAFMSLIGNTLLNEIVNEKHVLHPSSILKLLHTGILKSLHQNAGEVNCQDGMEMSLCVIDYQKKIIEFAGAMNPIYIVKDNTITVMKPDVLAIGGVSSIARKDAKTEFTTHQIQMEDNMLLYLFTDGYMDQFGGPQNKKFNTTQFKKLLLEIETLDMDKQKQAIEQAMNKWKGNSRQIDDMLVIGLRL